MSDKKAFQNCFKNKMKIKVNKKIIAAAGILLFLMSCTHYIDIYRTVWQEQPVLADGNPIEWAIPLKFYDDKIGRAHV